MHYLQSADSFIDDTCSRAQDENTATLVQHKVREENKNQ